MKKTIICQQERTIQENNEALLLLERNKVDIMNEVARANHEIEELKAKLAKKNNVLKNSQDLQDTLLLQAEKLRLEKEQLNQRCENAVNEMRDRLQVKDNIILQVREEIEKYIKLQREVKQRNEVLKGRLEKREKIVTGLKTKLTMLTSWSVRSASVTQLTPPAPTSSLNLKVAVNSVICYRHLIHDEREIRNVVPANLYFFTFELNCVRAILSHGCSIFSFLVSKVLSSVSSLGLSSSIMC
ncbi:unnamed protein product [Porites evermanni]|uniref:Uncharacterized protein n=1 Tax=Porites evermanni TaxID=104178 RepID=A0ABN8PCV4_9CNID|nr:unnamed protein product [Porites evermanni]